MSAAPEIKRAIWTPSWYEMDQSLGIGASNKFWFFQDLNSVTNIADDIDMVFFNQLDSTVNSQLRFANVVEIHHPILGQLSRVDTDGLDYIFATIDGKEILVNAEEEPGKSYDEDIDIDDWSVVACLTNVSEAISDIV